MAARSVRDQHQMPHCGAPSVHEGEWMMVQRGMSRDLANNRAPFVDGRCWTRRGEGCEACFILRDW